MLDKNDVSKRQLIIQAAAEIFSSRGYHTAKIEEIAQQAGIGKGTVYEYFQSKEQLFRDTVKEGITIVDLAIQEQIAQETTTRGKLIAFARKTIEIGRKYRFIAKLFIMDTSFMDHDFHEWLVERYGQSLKTIENIIRDGIAIKQLRPLDAACFAQVLSGGIGTVAGPLSLVEITPQNEERIAAEIVDYFLQGISLER